jgi:hypothetical protein
MFKFLKNLKPKKGKVIEPAEVFPDITAQQLVQRFHSESALCDPSHRRILLEAAEETHAQIQLRSKATSVKNDAANRCRDLVHLQSSVTDLRASQQDLHARATVMQDHIAAHDAPIPFIQDKTDEVENKMRSLVAMTDMIQEAAGTLEVDLKASAQKRARSRNRARMRSSLEQHAQGMGELDFDPSASCLEFGRSRVDLDMERPLTELVRETHEYLDENSRTWEQIDMNALNKELAAVKVLLEEYEESTLRREERLALTERRQECAVAT